MVREADILPIISERCANKLGEVKNKHCPLPYTWRVWLHLCTAQSAYQFYEEIIELSVSRTGFDIATERIRRRAQHLYCIRIMQTADAVLWIQGNSTSSRRRSAIQQTDQLSHIAHVSLKLCITTYHSGKHTSDCEWHWKTTCNRQPLISIPQPEQRCRVGSGQVKSGQDFRILRRVVSGQKFYKFYFCLLFKISKNKHVLMFYFVVHNACHTFSCMSCLQQLWIFGLYGAI